MPDKLDRQQELEEKRYEIGMNQVSKELDDEESQPDRDHEMYFLAETLGVEDHDY